MKERRWPGGLVLLHHRHLERHAVKPAGCITESTPIPFHQTGDVVRCRFDLPRIGRNSCYVYVGAARANPKPVGGVAEMSQAAPPKDPKIAGLPKLNYLIATVLASAE